MSPRSYNRRLLVEALEQRDNPAGNITTSLAGGVLTLTGTDQNDSLTIKQTGAADFTITGTVDTTINDVASATFTGVSSIRMLLNGGYDGVELDQTVAFNLPGSLFINAGDGDNNIQLKTPVTGVTVKDFTYIGGEGNDTVVFGQTATTNQVNGPVSLTFGNGGSATSISTTTLTGDITVKAGIGVDTFTLSGSTAKNVNVDVGFGDGSLSIISNTINGALNYKSLDGADSFNISGTEVRGKTGININAGIGNVTSILTGPINVPAGGLTITGKNGTNTTTMTGDITMLGDMRVSNLNILHTNNSGVKTVGNLSLTAEDILLNSGGGTWNVNKNLALNATSPSGLILNSLAILNLEGNLTSSSTSSNSVNIVGGLIKGTISVTSKKDQASFSQPADTITPTLTVNKAINVRAYSNATLLLNPTVSTFNGNITLNSTFGNSLFESKTGNASFKGISLKSFGSAITNLTSPGEINVVGNVSLTSTNSGAVFSDAAATGKLTIDGTLRISGGGTPNTQTGISISATSGSERKITKDVTVSSSAIAAGVLSSANLTLQGKLNITGATRANLTGSSSGTVTINRDLTLTTKYGITEFRLQGTGNYNIGGKTTVTGEKDALFKLDQAGTASTLTGDIAVNSGRGKASFEVANGGKTFKGNVNLKGYQTTWTQNTSLLTTYEKSVTLNSGSGSDTVQVQNQFSVLGDTNLNLGEGISNVEFSSSSSAVDFGGKLIVKTGSSNDQIKLINIQAAKDVSVTSLAGSDLLRVDGSVAFNFGSVFTGNFIADLGIGDDVIELGRLAGIVSQAAVTFNGKVTIKTGAGNDQLSLGRSGSDGGDTNSINVFSISGSTIDGGSGYNIFDDETGQPATATVDLSGFTDPT